MSGSLTVVRISFVRVCEVSSVDGCKVSKQKNEKMENFDERKLAILAMMKKYILLFVFRLLTF